MKHTLSYTLGLIALAMSAFVNLPASAATANGPYYATPSWDQQLPASIRFIVLSNWVDANYPSGGAAVLDRETGLVWQRSPLAPSATSTNWALAHELVCPSAKTGGRYGWRLPTAPELVSLIDPNAASAPPLPAGHPFEGLLSSEQFWTDTPYPGDPAYAVAVGWSNLSILPGVGGAAKALNHGVWCVRGGGVGPQ